MGITAITGILTLGFPLASLIHIPTHITHIMPILITLTHITRLWFQRLLHHPFTLSRTVNSQRHPGKETITGITAPSPRGITHT